MRVGTYARISDDVGQTGLGVARQQHDTRKLVKLRGWTLIEEYKDDDKSAYQRRVVRKNFERMLDDLASGVIQGIVVYDLDRLARKPTDLERIIDLYDRGPLVFATVRGDVDLSTPDGRTMARVLVAFADKASTDTARRMARKKLELAEAGVGSSNYRPYGWNEDRLTLNEPEAEILRQAAGDVLSGTGLFIICDRLNQRGIKTVRGNTWKTHAMRRVLSAPRMAGFAVYQRELLTDSAGQPVKGKWEPILDEATWRAVCGVLASTKRQVERTTTGLLSGITRCGRCGSGMGIARKPKGNYYHCFGKDSGGCAGIGISADKLEAQVEALLFAYVDQKIETPEPKWEGQQRLIQINEKIAELMEQYRTGLSGKIVFPMVRKLETERDELQAEQASFVRMRSRKSLITVAIKWDDLDVYRKREVIQSVIEAVVVKPVGRGVGHYDPSRVDIVPLQ